MKYKMIVRKIAAIGLCAMLCIPANLQTVHAEETDDNSVYTGYVEDFLRPAESIHQESEQEVLRGADPLPAKYTTPNLPPVRSQSPYGTCWAFSSIACMEIYLMNHPEVAGELSSIDLSELHLAYFANRSVVDPLGGTEGDCYDYTQTDYLNAGGSYGMALNVLQDWVGAVDEETVRYGTASTVLTSGINDNLAYGEDLYHLQGYRRISMTDRSDIKQAVMDYGAVGISYYAQRAGEYFNDGNNAYYCPTDKTTNHAVTIVGWNDNYDKNNFNTPPENNGAWIVRNSWGTGWGDRGYFYLSYEDASIGPDGQVFIAELANNYQHNYQYDGAKTFVPTWNMPETANVFTVKGTEAQRLEAVSFESYSVNLNYTIRIFKNPTNVINSESGISSIDPETGTLAATLTGTTDYEGMYTIKLEEPIRLEPGEVFAVAVKLVGEDGKYGEILRDYKMSGETTSGGVDQSLAYNGAFWYDYGALNNENFHIKAYTNDVSYSNAVAVTGVTLSEQQATVARGNTKTLTTKIAPANATNKTVNWSSSNTSVATVDGNGKVTAVAAGQAIITATTADGGYQASCTLKVDVPLQQIKLNQTALSLKTGENSQLQVTYDPTDTTADKTVTWSSSNTSVATVDGTGRVTAVGAGQAVITAKAGSLQASCSINVTVPQSAEETGSDSNNKSENGGSIDAGESTESGNGRENGGSMDTGNSADAGGNTNGGNSAGTGGSTNSGNGGSAVAQTGWVCDGGIWYYINSDGKKATGWLNDGGTWYYMNTDGSMVTGWICDGGIWYYMNPSGAMATGWVNDGGIWYYMNANGSMATGWVCDGGAWYYMNANGSMATGWVYDGRAWYYMRSSGSMVTGWVYTGGHWYYMKSSGVMATGWLYTGGHWYYLYSDGSMAVNIKIGRYRIGADGICK